MNPKNNQENENMHENDDILDSLNESDHRQQHSSDYFKKFDDLAKTKEISGTYNQINDLLNVFNVKLNQKLSSHEKEFMIAYKEQMTHVQSELRSLKSKIDEETLKQKSDQKLKILEEERDYFRSEALRLDKLCKEQSQLLEEYKFKINLSKEEKSYYEGFVIETKKENNSLKLELINLYQQKGEKDTNYARNRINQLKSASSIKNTSCKAQESHQYRIQSHKNIRSERKDQFFSTQPQGFGLKNKMVSQNEYRENLNDVNELNTQLLHLKTSNQKNEDLIHHLLMKKDQESQKIKEYKHVYNQLLIDRGELEEILVSCIQEIKKDIVKRKQLDKNFNHKFKQNLDLIGLENFQSTDKKKLLLTFMSDDKILESLYYLTFGVKEDEQNNKLTKNWKFSVVDANKKYKQFKNTADKMNLNRCIVSREVGSRDIIQTKKAKDLIKQIKQV